MSILNTIKKHTTNNYNSTVNTKISHNLPKRDKHYYRKYKMLHYQKIHGIQERYYYNYRDKLNASKRKKYANDASYRQHRSHVRKIYYYNHKHFR